jgi:pimeloyl-ACP methyl ester carboxylesterase
VIDVIPDWTLHEGSGPYLLLVHGFLSSSAQWQLNLDSLAEVCQPVTINLFGHAGSPTPEDAACYHPQYYGQCFEQIRQQLDAPQWYLLGYSLGAGLTIRYALDYPERVTGHLFTNSTSALADEALLADWRESLPATRKAIALDGQRALARLPVHPRHAWRLPKDVREALLTDAENHDPDGISRTLEITNLNASVRGDVAANRRPARLLHGIREKRFTRFAAYADKAMPMMERIEIDAGHGLNMEAADAFNRAVCSFISDPQS